MRPDSNVTSSSVSTKTRSEMTEKPPDSGPSSRPLDSTRDARSALGGCRARASDRGVGFSRMQHLWRIVLRRWGQVTCMAGRLYCCLVQAARSGSGLFHSRNRFFGCEAILAPQSAAPPRRLSDQKFVGEGQNASLSRVFAAPPPQPSRRCFPTWLVLPIAPGVSPRKPENLASRAAGFVP